MAAEPPDGAERLRLTGGSWTDNSGIVKLLPDAAVRRVEREDSNGGWTGPAEIIVMNPSKLGPSAAFGMVHIITKAVLSLTVCW